MLEDFDINFLEFEENLSKRIDRMKYDYSIIRAGRANPRMLDKVCANYYGVMTPISQMANISVPEARMIVISPWDISTVKEINKAIMSSDIGVTPTDDGRLIRLVFPSLTEDRRKEIAKEVRSLAEEARISVRGLRKDILEVFKSAEKDKQLTKDELETANEKVQKMVDKYNGIIDDLCTSKEKEIMEV